MKSSKEAGFENHVFKSDTAKRRFGSHDLGRQGYAVCVIIFLLGVSIYRGKGGEGQLELEFLKSTLMKLNTIVLAVQILLCYQLCDN